MKEKNHQKKRQGGTLMWLLFFLVGAGLCILPVVRDWLHGQRDNQAYADLARFPDVSASAPAWSETEEEEKPASSATNVRGDACEKEQNAEVSDDARTEAGGSFAGSPSWREDNAAYRQYVARMQRCLKLNPDFVAWLTIPDTPIDYPVVQSDRSNYYLHHLFTGEKSKLGCLFSLGNADYDKPSPNIAIYGHHLSGSDAMFSSLMAYKDRAYGEAHATLRLETLTGIRTYRIFAVCNTRVGDWLPDEASFASEEHFRDFVREARERSLYDLEVPVKENAHVLSLITCDRSFGGVSGRLVVMAVGWDDRWDGTMQGDFPAQNTQTPLSLSGMSESAQ